MTMKGRARACLDNTQALEWALKDSQELGWKTDRDMERICALIVLYAGLLGGEESGTD